MEQPGAEADVLVRPTERQRLAGESSAPSPQALSGLADEDRLILKMFFPDGMIRAQIARLLHLDQQRLYPRFLGLMAGCRRPWPRRADGRRRPRHHRRRRI